MRAISEVEIINGYVSSTRLLTEKKYDAFASRQVFEHLTDPLDVLLGIKQTLKTGAVGLIEVPNGYRAFRESRFYEFFPDHINYFSVNSLVGLATDAGFVAMECCESFDGDYLELWLRNDTDSEDPLALLRDTRTRIVQALNAYILKLSIEGKKILIWGCGAKTLSILAACEDISGKITAVIDGDPHKQGLYVPNTNLKIISPNELKDLEPDVILILALSYRAEILAQIRAVLSTPLQIFTLSDRGEIVEL